MLSLRNDTDKRKNVGIMGKLSGNKRENEELKDAIMQSYKQLEDLKKERQRMLDEFDRNTEILKQLRLQIEEILEK